MKFRSTIFAATAVAMASFGAGFAQAEEAPNADTVLVTVDGTDITLGHMIALRSNLPPHFDQMANEVLFDGILNQLVQHTLLAQSLENGPSRHSVLTIENESRAIKAGQAINAVASATISEAEIEAAYQAEFVQIERETEFNAAHILVKTKEEAQSLVDQLAGGGVFGDLAREFSTGPSGASGGELGWFGKGVMVEPFFDAVVKLQPGEVSDPVETQFGWHVIKLLETRSMDRPELADVREQIEASLREKAFETHIEGLESKAKITRTDTSKIDPALLGNTELLEN